MELTPPNQQPLGTRLVRGLIAVAISISLVSCTAPADEASSRPMGDSVALTIDVADDRALVRSLPPLSPSLTEEQGVAFQRAFAEALGGRTGSVAMGTRSGLVEFRVGPDDTALADALLDRYGPLIDVVVGQLAYPDPGTENHCRSLPRENPLDLAMELTGLRQSDARLTAVVEVSDPRGAAPYLEFSDPGLVYLTDADGTVVSDSDVFGQAGVGIEIDFEVTELVSIDVGGSVMSCRPELGFRLPAGEYTAYGVIEVFDRTDQPQAWTVRTEPLTVSIT